MLLLEKGGFLLTHCNRKSKSKAFPMLSLFGDGDAVPILINAKVVRVT
jgi:hypothetical protein